MPPSTRSAVPDTVEFSVEDATLNTWVEEAGVYLNLEPSAPDPDAAEPPPSDQS